MYFRTDDDVRACDDVRYELMPFIQSQYAASVRITAILQSCKDHILPDADIALFYDKMFNIQTAEGYGLDVWGNIIGISRYIQSHDDPSETLTLDDENYRKLLFVKAAANIMDSSMYSLNYIIKKLYPNLTCYVQLASNWQEDDGFIYDANPMEINFIFFNHHLSDLERSIFDVVGSFNRGAGVGWNLLEYIQDDVFGFKGSELQPFDQGVFFVPSGGA